MLPPGWDFLLALRLMDEGLERGNKSVGSQLSRWEKSGGSLVGFVTRRGNGPWDFMSEGQEGQGRDETMQNAQVYPACSPLAEST